MISFLRNKLTGWKELAGIELILLNEGFEIRACILEKKKGLISIQKSKDNLWSVDELKTFLGDNIPVCITLSGKGVLTKKLEANQETDVNKILLQAVPNAKAADFYLQLSGEDKIKHLSLVRRQIADDILQLFERNLIPVVSLSLGGIVLKALTAFEGDTYSIRVAEHIIEVKKGSVDKYNYGLITNSETNIKLGSEQLPERIAVAYSSALQQFLPGPVQADHSNVFDLKEEWLEKQMFTFLGWSALGFFLGLLLLNTIAFTWLSQKTEKFALASGLQKTQLVRLKALQKEVSEKEVFLKSAGWMNTSKASFFADRIAATIPASVMLTSLEINPLDEKASRDLRKQVFSDAMIVISGTCKRPIELNGWIKRIKDFAWVKKVNVENYNYNSEENTGTFKVEITFG